MLPLNILSRQCIIIIIIISSSSSESGSCSYACCDNTAM